VASDQLPVPPTQYLLAESVIIWVELVAWTQLFGEIVNTESRGAALLDVAWDAETADIFSTAAPATGAAPPNG
jgi:hypothetical protein